MEKENRKFMIKSQNTRLGITLIELVVVLGIMFLCLALLLPAITSSRESARKADCANRLRQIALIINQKGPVDFETVARDLNAVPNGQSLDLSNANISLFRCPSYYHGTRKQNEMKSFSAYAGCSGDGVFSGPYGTINQRNEWTDGLSSTIALGDIRCNDIDPAPSWFYTPKASAKHKINSKIYDSNTRNYSFGSFHPQGANFGFLDGAVNFLSEKIDEKVFKALSTVNNGEVALPQ